MNILEKVKNLNKRISILKEQNSSKVFPDKKIKVINSEDFKKIVKFNIKKRLESHREHYQKNNYEKGLNVLNKIDDWLEKQNINTIASEYAEYLKGYIAQDMMRDLSFLSVSLEFSNFDVMCKANLSPTGFRIFGGMTYEREGNQLRFFKLPVHMRFQSSPKIFDELENLNQSEISIENFIETTFGIMISPSALEFPITKNNFSLNKIPSEVYQYLEKLNVSADRSEFYMKWLKDSGRELTEKTFEDTIKSQKVGKVLSKL